MDSDAEPQVLIEPAELLVVEVDVKELAGLERLRDRVVEVQPDHVLVRDLGVDAHHLGILQRRDERQIRGRGREIQIAARFVRLRLEREAEAVLLVA